jgi:hypothetical protein
LLKRKSENLQKYDWKNFPRIKNETNSWQIDSPPL